MPDPTTGAGFDAPTPEVAYLSAPKMLSEAAALLDLSARRQAATAAAVAAGGTYEDPDERTYLLRRAALADRLSIEYPDVEDFLTDAVRLAHELAAYDRDHGTGQGPIGPDAIEWDPSHRPYVRQEYEVTR
ncbi:hypothetical protein [Streptomyces sp. SS]|uniref:hypothetical protein n=1 Tax=Streptomyces sp. SS TaxID=260742 RepID=UPI0002ED1606|nr:hypothetical protein [Streptomyces sp. SS]